MFELDMNKINAIRFFDLPSPNELSPCVLFGAKDTGLLISNQLIEGNYKIACFCDNNKMIWGSAFNGIHIISTNELSEFDKATPILITTNVCWVNEVVNQLSNMGFTKLFKCNFSIHTPKNNDFQYQTDLILEAKDKISQVYNMLKDEKSKLIYSQLINYRLTANPKYLEYGVDRYYDQYFDGDIIKFGEDEIFIDGGGYDGNSSVIFIEKSKEFYEKIYIFEPDKDNYKTILGNTSLISDKIKVFNLAVSDKSAVLKFLAKDRNSFIRDVGGRIDASGNIEVHAVSLDELIDKATFIKLDVEGQELAALKGSSRLISVYKPKLAICIYHVLEHLWEIPLQMKALNPEYEIYIRRYAFDHKESICYAI